MESNYRDGPVGHKNSFKMKGHVHCKTLSIFQPIGLAIGVVCTLQKLNC